MRASTSRGKAPILVTPPFLHHITPRHAQIPPPPQPRRARAVAAAPSNTPVQKRRHCCCSARSLLTVPCAFQSSPMPTHECCNGKKLDPRNFPKRRHNTSRQADSAAVAESGAHVADGERRFVTGGVVGRVPVDDAGSAPDGTPRQVGARPIEASAGRLGQDEVEPRRQRALRARARALLRSQRAGAFSCRWPSAGRNDCRSLGSV